MKLSQRGHWLQMPDGTYRLHGVRRKTTWLSDEERAELYAKAGVRPPDQAHPPFSWPQGQQDDSLHFGAADLGRQDGRGVWRNNDGDLVDLDDDELDHGGDEEVVHPGRHTEPAEGGEEDDDPTRGAGAETESTKYAGTLGKREVRAIMKLAALKNLTYEEARRQMALTPPSPLPPSKAEYRRGVKYASRHGVSFEDGLRAIRDGGK
jgi:hypothetical protein